MKENYKSVERKYRLDYWIGVGIANLSVAVSATALGFFIADHLNNRHDDRISNCKPCLFYMCNGWSNENYSNVLSCNIGFYFWNFILFNIT